MKKRTNPVNLEEIWHLILEDQVFVLQKDRETCLSSQNPAFLHESGSNKKASGFDYKTGRWFPSFYRCKPSYFAFKGRVKKLECL